MQRRVAIVTGAGRQRGIGRAIAIALATDGVAVVVHERTADPGRWPEHEVASGWHGARSVVDEIEAMGVAAVAVAGDIAEAATAEALSEAAGSLGELATLVNNAGSPGEANAWLAHTVPDDVWDETVRVNLTSLHRLGRVLIPRMIESTAPDRSIVHLSSTAGHRALARYGAYCASKAAVERLAEQQALELARYGIRVNCVAPGSTSTDMIDGTLHRAAVVARTPDDVLRAAVVKQIPLRRFAEPGEIADAVAFLASSRARYITGQVLTVDGGLTLT